VQQQHERASAHLGDVKAGTVGVHETVRPVSIDQDTTFID
jgi:hypothetical protein